MNVELRAGMVSLGTRLGPVSHSRVVALSLPDLYLHSNTLAVKKTKFVTTNFPHTSKWVWHQLSYIDIH